MNSRVKYLTLNSIARVLTVGFRIVPTRGHAFLHGTPGSEGNITEVARAILENTEIKVFWAEPPSEEFLRRNGLDRASRIKLIRRLYSLKSVWAYLSSSYIFHTHGLFGDPVPSINRPVVNVWHGDSIKLGKLSPHRTLRGPSATFLVSSCQLLGSKKAERAGLSADKLLLVGNPRVDQFLHPASNEALAAIGVPSDAPFVLWMPTFRVAKSKSGDIAWSNTTDPATDRALVVQIEALASELAAQGINLVVKPHRLDAVSRQVRGAYLVNEESLESSGIGLYSFLARSAGLISDYSSVWVDYLALDRPIGFFVPDLANFSDSRGYYPPEMFAHLPGPNLMDKSGMADFVSDIIGQDTIGTERRLKCRDFLGYVKEQDIALRLLEAVGITTT